VIIAADTHVVESAWHGRGICGDSACSLSQIIAYAVRGRHDVVLAGDILDRRTNESYPVAVVTSALERLHRAGLNLYYVEGQHDMSDPPWLSIHPAAVPLEGRVVQLLDRKWTGLSFRPAGRLQEALKAIAPEADVLVCHQTWQQLASPVMAAHGSTTDIPGHIRLVISGDNHSLVGLYDLPDSLGGKLQLLSPGSTHMLAINEPPAKYFWVTDDGKSFRRVRLKTRPVVEWPELRTTRDVDEFVSGVAAALEAAADSSLPEGVRKPLLRVVCHCDLAEHRPRIMRAVGERAHVFWKEIAPDSQPVTVADSGWNTLETALDDYLKACGRSDLAGDARRLLQAADVAAELRRMRSDYVDKEDTTAELRAASAS